MHRRITTWFMMLMLILVPFISALGSGAAQGGTSDVAIVTSENGQAVYDACFILVNFSNEGCDENRDGQITFQDIPLGTYTLRQTRDLGPGRSVADTTITVTGAMGGDGWERFSVSVNTSGSSGQTNTGQGGSSDVAIVATENGQSVYDACFILVGYGNEGCDENQDGKITFQDIPLGSYTLHQTRNLGSGRSMPDSTIQVTGAADPDGWERFYVSIGDKTDTSSSDSSSNDPAPSAQLANAVVDSGSPSLPPGIVRLPFNGRYEVTQVPGCGSHSWADLPKQYNEMNIRAIDFGLYDGTEVVAAGEGDIIDPYSDPGDSHILVIDHGNGVRSYYAHLKELRVDVGDHVFPGDVIGLSGDVGSPGQPHLHFSVTTGGDPSTTGVAANINGLPGIEWRLDVPNADGFVSPCRPAGSEADIAVGGAVMQNPVAPTVPVATDEPATMMVVGYDRNAAARAAYDNLSNDYMYENDSAWYASTVLWAGGLPQTDEWTSSAVAWPQDLVNYLTSSHRLDEQSSYTPATMSQLSWSDNSAGGAMLGDLIAYDWEGDGIIDHVAVVTNINSDGFPEVSEHSPTQENRYWTYSLTADNWIETAMPGSVAYLIHISPMTIPDF